MLYPGTAALKITEDLSDMYAETFSTPPWNKAHDAPRHVIADRFAERLRTDAVRPGFRLAVTRSEQAITGFSSGWRTQDPFRSDRAYWKVAAYLGPQRVSRMLIDAFEVDELAVRPDAQRNGLGRDLLKQITDAAPHGRAWLLTWKGAPETVGFYRHLGWYEVMPAAGYDDSILVFLAPNHPEIPR